MTRRGEAAKRQRSEQTQQQQRGAAVVRGSVGDDRRHRYSSAASQPVRGMRQSRSAPTLDVSSLIRAAILANRSSCDSLLQLVGEEDTDTTVDDEIAESDTDGSDDGTDVVSLLHHALQDSDSLSADSSALPDLGRSDDDDDDNILLSSRVPFASSCRGSGCSPNRSAKRRATRRRESSPSSAKGHARHDKGSRGNRGSMSERTSARRGKPRVKPSSSGDLHATERICLIPPLSPRLAASPTLTVVLDLDETLVFARNSVVVVRPFITELVVACARNNCEVVLWSASVTPYVNWIIHAVNRIVTQRWFHYVVARSDLWFKEVGPSLKDLSWLQRDVSRVLVVENSPASMQLQPDNVVLVEDFYGDNTEDQSLIFVGQLVERLSHAIADGRSAAEALAADVVTVSATFQLSSEHSATGSPSVVTSRALRYTPRDNDHRIYAGIAPSSVGA